MQWKGINYKSRKKSYSKDIDKLTQENKRLRAQEHQPKITSDSPRTQRRSYKPDGEYSESHRRRLKRLRTDDCSQSLLWLESEGYVPVTVTVVNTSTGREETIALQNST